MMCSVYCFEYAPCSMVYAVLWLYLLSLPWLQGFWCQHGDHLGSTGPRGGMLAPWALLSGYITNFQWIQTSHCSPILRRWFTGASTDFGLKSKTHISVRSHEVMATQMTSKYTVCLVVRPILYIEMAPEWNSNDLSNLPWWRHGFHSQESVMRIQIHTYRWWCLMLAPNILIAHNCNLRTKHVTSAFLLLILQTAQACYRFCKSFNL